MSGVVAPTADALPRNGPRGRTDAPVAAGAAAGMRREMDECAFRALYEQTVRPLRAYLLRVCGNGALADDLLQESYLRLVRARFVGSSPEHTRHYLFRIATNLLNDHFRRPRRDTAELPEVVPAPDTVGGLDLRRDVATVLGAVPARERIMLWLAYVEGWSHQEIATLLNLQAVSVRVLLFRARSRLAELLRAKGLAPAAPPGERS
jgi:RNA polymerase sigma-70 factor (ECF subfamily)